MYKILLSKKASKFLSKLDRKSYQIVSDAIFRLAEFRTAKNLDIKPLKGKYPSQWRLRVASKRILFTVEEKEKIIKIWLIGERGNIY